MLQLSQLKWSVTAFVVISIVGIVGFMVLEQLSFSDAMYLTIVTMATVGYGDIVPRTMAGRIFTMILIVFGVGTAYYTMGLVVSMAIDGKLKDMLGRRSMLRRIASMQEHVIVCGAGKVGANVIRSLENEGETFVVIEKDEVIYEQLVEQKVLAVFGDATLDEVLLSAGLDRARGVITALSHDADNVYVTLTAKSLNPGITVVARADRPEAEEKLRRAGADTVIFPSVMGGRQLVSAMLKPVIMDFVENLFYNQELHMDIAEITISPTSPLVGKTVAGSSIKEKFDSIVVAIKRGQTLITNPRAEEMIEAGDIMIALGQRRPLSELNEMASGRLFG